MKSPVIDGTLVNPIVFDIVKLFDRPTSRLVIGGVYTTQKPGTPLGCNKCRGTKLEVYERFVFSAHLTLLDGTLAVDVCLSVRRSVRLSNAWIVTKRNNFQSLYINAVR